MISVTECAEFIPCGRTALSYHPGKLLLDRKPLREFSGLEIDGFAANVRRHPIVDRSLIQGLDDDDDFEESVASKESWIVRAEKSGAVETISELYVKGNSVVWSQSNHVIKSFTVEGKVKQALWCDFYTYLNRPSIIGSLTTLPATPGKPVVTEADENLGEPLPSVCIQESGTLKIFLENGQDFSFALLFPIKRCWTCKYGLLLERDCRSKIHEQLPVLFALLHPLDDLTRVITKHGQRIREIVNDNQKIIFTSIDPSICVIFNSEAGRHSVWKIRQATTVENKHNGSGGINSFPPPFSSADATPPLGLSGSISRSHSRASGLASHSVTPVNSHNNSVMTPVQHRTPSQQPQEQQVSPFATLAAICRSPSATSFPSNNLASRLMMTPNTSLISSSRLGDDTTNLTQQLEPLPPEISLCLEHIWTEPSGTNNDGPTDKIFLSRDTIGRQYLNYLQKHLDTLSVIRYGESNESQLIFTIVQSIPAVDAVFIESLDMTLTLDPGSTSLTLYSGTTKVSRVMFNTCSTQMASIAHEISALNLDSTPTATKRSSIVTSSRPPSASLDQTAKFNDSLLTFSPIEEAPTPATSTTIRTVQTKPMRIEALRDAVLNRVTLRYFNGSHLTLTLPSMATTPLVRRCLAAVRTALSREAALHLQSQWYAVRNAPGPTSISPSREWELFSRCLLGLIGYHTERLNTDSSSLTSPTSASSSSKKMRKDDEGSDCDWQHLLSSSQHQEVGQQISCLLGLDYVPPSSSDKNDYRNEETDLVDTNANLFHFLPSILWSLHLLYENSKLDKSHWDGLRLLASLLVRLAADLRMPLYIDHYWRDFHDVCPLPMSAVSTGQISEAMVEKLIPPPQMLPTPPSISNHLRNILLRKYSDLTPFPYMPTVAKRTKDIISCFVLYSSPTDDEIVNLDPFIKVVQIPGNRSEKRISSIKVSSSKLCERMVELLVDLGFNTEVVESIPAGFSLPLRSAIYECRHNPPSGWSKEAYELIGRYDLVNQCLDKSAYEKKKKKAVEPPENLTSGQTALGGSAEVEDGTEGVEGTIASLRWPYDRRVSEVRRLLQSAKPVTVSVQQRPEMSDHEFVEEQEKCLHALCIRTMALPVGRGALTLRTATPLVTETLPIPKLCLTGRAPPRGATVEMDHIDVAPNEERWPTFHNGVAAGLQMSAAAAASQIDSAWITFNKPKENLHPNNNGNHCLIEHAGFLMALGLNGHLTKLGKLKSFDYLMKGSEMISIGILLGISAAKRGSMDVLATKKVSTQLEALLPATATELPLSHTTQVAGLIGLGLLYQGTGHRHMAEVCLGELGRPPGPELENCTDRESYSLAAGLALGMITLGQGNELTKGPLTDINLPDALYHHMVGGPRSAITHRHMYRSPSYQIQEGDSINVDVTSPGATLALGLMFFRSGNEAIAEWMAIPQTQFLLEFVRPDFLMLRTLAKGLILWNKITPSEEWIESHVPESIRPYCLVRPADNPPPGVDYETINQAYCNIMAGAALAMALRFAGSCNAAAFAVLYKLTRRLIAISKRSVAELAGKATIEQTICVQVLSMAVVMAGSGDLEIIRIVRYLRSRVGNTNSTVTYGSHMALHMALGLLFLGGGRYTLSTEPEAVAAMVCAFFPKFPTHSNDNRYHLQALRHLYVLAAEPRLIVPRDVESGQQVYCHVNIEYKDTLWYKNRSLTMKIPAMLPELRYLRHVYIDDDRYYPVHFELDKNWDCLIKLLMVNNGNLEVKQRAGCVSYAEDPHGFRSLMAQCLTRDPSFQWSAGSRLLGNFSTVLGVNNFHNIFLSNNGTSKGKSRMQQLIGTLLYECACQEKLDFLPVWISTFSALDQLTKEGLSLNAAAQLSLILAFADVKSKGSLLSPEISSSVRQSLHRIMDFWKAEMQDHLRAYLSGSIGGGSENTLKLTTFLVVNNLPQVVQTCDNVTNNLRNINPLEWLKSMSGNTAYNLYSMIK